MKIYSELYESSISFSKLEMSSISKKIEESSQIEPDSIRTILINSFKEEVKDYQPEEYLITINPEGDLNLIKKEFEIEENEKSEEYFNLNDISAIIKERDIMEDASFFCNSEDNNNNNYFLIRETEKFPNISVKDYKEEKNSFLNLQNSIINEKLFKNNQEIINDKKGNQNQFKKAIKGENKSLKFSSKLDNNNIFIERELPKFIPHEEKEEYNNYCPHMENSKCPKISSSFEKNLKANIFSESQFSMIDYQHNDKLFQQQNNSKMKYSEFFNSLTSNKDKSYCLYSQIISDNQTNYLNVPQNYFPFLYQKIDNTLNNSIYSNKKRKRSPIYINDEQNLINIQNKSTFLKQNLNKIRTNLFKSKKNNNYGRKKKIMKK